ncbi:GntR family transcriptional regulator [Leucobacter sp. GX24907]
MTNPPPAMPAFNVADRRLPRETLKDSTEAIIRRALLDGTMQPGEIYSANALAAQLGISNSPAREAMVTLVDKGLLELVRNRGFRVIEMSDHDRREVYDLRMLIEVDAVRKVAAHGVDEQQAQDLRDACEAIVTVGESRDSVEYLEADQNFHVGLVSLLGNSRLTSIVENLRDQSRINGGYDESDLIDKSVLEHRAITEAVIAGDAELAKELMQRHLDYACPDGK